MAHIIDLAQRRTAYEEPAHFYNSEHRARVMEFTPKIARCSICLSPHHRASQCTRRERDTLQLGD